MRVFVEGTVAGIIATLDASARAAGFDEFDVVVVAQANATLGVSQSPRTSTGVILTPSIIRVQSVNRLGTDTPSDCKPEVRTVNHRVREDDGELFKCNSRCA